jgi:hypothetical protein
MKVNFKSINVEDCDSCVFNKFRSSKMGLGSWHVCVLTKEIISDQNNYSAEEWKRKGEKFPKLCPFNKTKKVTITLSKELDKSRDYDSKIDFDLID